MSKVPQFIRTLFATFPLHTYPPLPIDDNVNIDKPYELYVYNLKDGWPTDPDGIKAFLMLQYLKLDYNINVSSYHVSGQGTLPYLIENGKKKTVVYKTEEDIENKLVQWDPKSEVSRHWINTSLGDAFLAHSLTNPSLAISIYEGDQDKKLPGLIQDAAWRFWVEQTKQLLSVRYSNVLTWDKNTVNKQSDLDEILRTAVECFKGIEAMLSDSQSGFLGAQLGPLDIVVYAYIRSIMVWMSHSELGLSVPESLIQHSKLCEEEMGLR
jgi:hypothetical protein